MSTIKLGPAGGERGEGRPGEDMAGRNGREYWLVCMIKGVESKSS